MFFISTVCLCVPQEKVIPCLLRLKQASDPGLRAAVREALALVGYHAPVKGRGIRILSIDGGGLRYKFGSFCYCAMEVNNVKSIQSRTKWHLLQPRLCLKSDSLRLLAGPICQVNVFLCNVQLNG